MFRTTLCSLLVCLILVPVSTTSAGNAPPRTDPGDGTFSVDKGSSLDANWFYQENAANKVDSIDPPGLLDDGLNSDDIDALSLGTSNGFQLGFSVTRNSTGLANTDSQREYLKVDGGNGAPADLFLGEQLGNIRFGTNETGTNMLHTDAPMFKLQEGESQSIDGYDFDDVAGFTTAVVSFSDDSPILATLPGGTLPGGGYTGGDVFTLDLNTGVPTLALAHTQLGLDPEDDIDALIVGPMGQLAYSLESGSPTTVPFGHSPAHVYESFPGDDGLPVPTVVLKSRQIGLAVGDDLDAMDLTFSHHATQPIFNEQPFEFEGGALFPQQVPFQIGDLPQLPGANVHFHAQDGDLFRAIAWPYEQIFDLPEAMIAIEGQEPVIFDPFVPFQFPEGGVASFSILFGADGPDSEAFGDLEFLLDFTGQGPGTNYDFVTDFVPGLRSADLDADGDVDQHDLAALRAGYGTSHNGDAFLRWQRQYDAPIGAITAVPEPTTSALVLLALAVSLCMEASRL